MARMPDYITASLPRKTGPRTAAVDIEVMASHPVLVQLRTAAMAIEDAIDRILGEK